MKLKSSLALVGALVVSYGCSAVNSVSSEKWFNKEEFVGLTDLSTSFDALSLEYSLDGVTEGLVEFDSCEEVEAVNESKVVQSQFPLYRKLEINCMAAKYYHQGDAASRDFMPGSFNVEVINDFPATVIPNRGGSSLEINPKKRLADLEQVEVVGQISSGFTLKVGTTEVDYILLSEVDVNGDGLQDWVVRLDWSDTDSFGEGTDLLVLTQKGSRADIEVINRYP